MCEKVQVASGGKCHNRCQPLLCVVGVVNIKPMSEQWQKTMVSRSTQTTHIVHGHGRMATWIAGILPGVKELFINSM